MSITRNPRTLSELTVEDRRAISGKGVKPNMARISECLHGIHMTDDPKRIEEFQHELSRVHSSQMHDYILVLEARCIDYWKIVGW